MSRRDRVGPILGMLAVTPVLDPIKVEDKLVVLMVFAGAVASACSKEFLSGTNANYPLDQLFLEHEWEQMLESAQAVNKLFAPYLKKERV